MPLHDPKATNGYATSLLEIDRQASFLDRAQIITGLKGAECQDLVNKNVGGTALNGTYVTFFQPYRCSCGAQSSKEGSVLNFCVADPWPRPAMIPELAPAASGIAPCSPAARCWRTSGTHAVRRMRAGVTATR